MKRRLLFNLFYLCMIWYCFAKIKRAETNKFQINNNYDEEKDLQKRLHTLKKLSEQASKRLANLNDYSTFYTSFVKNILRVRVPGTVGHHEVKEFIKNTLTKFKWDVQLDEFTSTTPLGDKKFTNILATLNPKAKRKLAFAAHYDSKLMKPVNGKYFLGAIDSAVPCAMLLDLASILTKSYNKDLNNSKLSEVSPMLLFLDGEEAFVKWDKSDSIYGARNLAQKLSTQVRMNSDITTKSITMLDSLDAFILLDLLGAKDPHIFDMYNSTSSLYKNLQDIEKQLHENNDINNESPYFVGSPPSSIFIEDDHVPFLEKGVPILHIIPVPFPKEWHTLEDDADALDPKTIENLLKIFRQFALEYFHFSP
ncbi:glutaminyl-peptide cyclotransferase [Hydra vulgaris]|uniref:glutaminyl-peptide cyclotransferase n=1 Tax=Hydra vulgaris TaxID=6087 RepID=UPI001F5EAC59|nr:glutaminyl-peptide cyclotransferase [Hydra vulgaris]